MPNVSQIGAKQNDLASLNCVDVVPNHSLTGAGGNITKLELGMEMPAAARIAVTKVDERLPDWFLYEGPVGGKWSPKTHFFGTDLGGPRTELPDNKQLFENWRWVYFGDISKSRVLLAAQIEADTIQDTLWYLGNSHAGIDSTEGMVVFGFGRGPKAQPLLRGSGKQFRIGFVETAHSHQNPGINIQTVANHAIAVIHFFNLKFEHAKTKSKPHVHIANPTGYEQAALTASGDPEGGLFFEDTRTKCSVCHRVNQQSGLVGPEMSQIGGKFDRPHLIESILEPSRQIVEGFRTTSLLTKDGSVVAGVVKERIEERIVLLDAGGKSVELSPKNTSSVLSIEYE